MSILDVGVISRDDTLGLVDTMGNLPGAVIRNILILSVDVRVGCFHVIKGSAFFMIIAYVRQHICPCLDDFLIGCICHPFADIMIILEIISQFRDIFDAQSRMTVMLTII